VSPKTATVDGLTRPTTRPTTRLTTGPTTGPTTRLTTKQAQEVLPPICDACGATMQLRWVDVSTAADTDLRWQLDIVRCLTPDCAARGVYSVGVTR